MREVEAALTGYPHYLDRVRHESYIPSTGSWAVALRVEAKTKALSDIRG
jgi:hypothetical protein